MMRRLLGGICIAAVTVSGLLLTGCVTDQAYRSLKGRNEQQAVLISQYEEQNRKLGMEVDTLSARLSEKERLVAHLEDKEQLIKAQLQQMSEKSAQLFSRLEQLGQLSGVSVVQTPEGVKVEVAAAVLFDSGKADIKPAGEETLKQVAVLLKAEKELIRIDGHTDSDPIKYSPYKSNWDLSGARARTVLEHLISQGIDSQRLYFSGFGPYRPVAPNATAEGKAKNRRVELLILAGTTAPQTDIPPEAGAPRRVTPPVRPAPSPTPEPTAEEPELPAE